MVIILFLILTNIAILLSWEDIIEKMKPIKTTEDFRIAMENFKIRQRRSCLNYRPKCDKLVCNGCILRREK